MSTFLLLLLTGLGLAGLYFLVASGLSLVFGLADVLNFAHGLFLSVGAYATWWAATSLPGAGSEGFGFVLATAFGVLAGAVVASIVELVLIRPLYRRTIAQVLVTVGLSLAGVALLQAIWGADPRPFPRPAWSAQVTNIAGAAVPNSSLLLALAAGVVLAGLLAFLRFTRVGLVIRAGVEDRSMVTALGTGLIALMYRYLPAVRLAWRHVLIGALVTTLLFQAGRWGIGLYLGRATQPSSFGAAASFAALLLWLYYSAQIFLLGAEFTACFGGIRDSQPAQAPARK